MEQDKPALSDKMQYVIGGFISVALALVYLYFTQDSVSPVLEASREAQNIEEKPNFQSDSQPDSQSDPQSLVQSAQHAKTSQPGKPLIDGLNPVAAEPDVLNSKPLLSPSEESDDQKRQNE